MKWVEKRPKSADANLKPGAGKWTVRVKLTPPDGTLFERELVAATKTAARKTRDNLYAAYNDLALAILAGEDRRPVKATPEAMTLQTLANRCRDEWWPARGRTVDVAEQYFQMMRDYVVPALGADRPVSSIDADTGTASSPRCGRRGPSREVPQRAWPRKFTTENDGASVKVKVR